MKRINGRNIVTDFSAYGDYPVKTVNFDLIDPNAVPFRYKWAIDIIQNLRNASIISYNTLDIGASDGTLGAMIARMTIDPNADNSNTPTVEIIESYPPAVIACEEIAKVVGVTV